MVVDVVEVELVSVLVVVVSVVEVKVPVVVEVVKEVLVIVEDDVVVVVDVVVVDASHTYWAKYKKLQPSIQQRGSPFGLSLPLMNANFAVVEMHKEAFTRTFSGHDGVYTRPPHQWLLWSSLILPIGPHLPISQ